MKKILLKLIPCVIVFVLALGCAASAARQNKLAGDLIRLHVVANSDSPEDQAIKLRVRDYVLANYGACFDGMSLHQARAFLEQDGLMDKMLARENLPPDLAEDLPADVNVRLVEEYFPEKRYDSFALPPGWYTALKIELGAAEGKNWWCVLYPPLCLSAAEDVTESGLSAGEIATITDGEQEIKLKFLSVELYCRAVEMLNH